MTAAGAQTDRYGRSRTRSFRQSFLVGYATRIGARLREAASAGKTAAEEAHGPSLLPVLAARDGAVDGACRAVPSPNTRKPYCALLASSWHSPMPSRLAEALPTGVSNPLPAWSDAGPAAAPHEQPLVVPQLPHT